MAYKLPRKIKLKESTIKDNPYNFKRDKKQEDSKVYRWFENKNGDIVSVVEGYYPDEANIRVSSGKGKFDSFEIRGGKDIILGSSDEKIIESANRGISRGRLK